MTVERSGSGDLTRRVRAAAAGVAAAVLIVACPAGARADLPDVPVAIGGGLTVMLDGATRSVLERLLADPPAPGDAGAAVFVDTLAGVLVARAADDPAKARAMAAYVRERAPGLGAGIDEALDLARPRPGIGTPPPAPGGAAAINSAAPNPDSPGPGVTSGAALGLDGLGGAAGGGALALDPRDGGPVGTAPGPGRGAAGDPGLAQDLPSVFRAVERGGRSGAAGVDSWAPIGGAPLSPASTGGGSGGGGGVGGGSLWGGGGGVGPEGLPAVDLQDVNELLETVFTALDTTRLPNDGFGIPVEDVTDLLETVLAALDTTRPPNDGSASPSLP